MFNNKAILFLLVGGILYLLFQDRINEGFNNIVDPIVGTYPPAVYRPYRLVEEGLKEIPYLPRQIRPPTGKVGWLPNYPNYLNQHIGNLPNCLQNYYKKVLNRPSEFI